MVGGGESAVCLRVVVVLSLLWCVASVAQHVGDPEPYQLLMIGANPITGASNFLLSLKSPTTYSVLTALTTDAMVTFSGQLTFFADNVDNPPQAPYDHSYFVWMQSQDLSTEDCRLVEYEWITNTTTTLLDLQGCQPYGMSWDNVTSGGAIWGLLYQNAPDAFTVGFYSLAQRTWTPFVTLSEISPLDWDFLSATVDAVNGLYYVIFLNSSTNYNWMATLNIRGPLKGKVTYQRFPTTLSTIGNLQGSPRRQISQAPARQPTAARAPIRSTITAPTTTATRLPDELIPRGNPNAEYIEFRYSARMQGLYTIAVNTTVTSVFTFYLATLDPVTLEITPFPNGDQVAGPTGALFGFCTITDSNPESVFYAGIGSNIVGWSLSTGKVVSTIDVPDVSCYCLA